MSDDVNYLLCNRIADIPRPYVPSRELACTDCGAAVWASSVSRSEAGDGAVVLCIPCGVVRSAHTGELAKALESPVPTPSQQAEIFAYTREWIDRHCEEQ